MNLSSEEIIQELKKGNRLIFEQVFRRYYKMLCLEAKGYISAEYLVEEIVCDVFTKIWQNRESLYIQSSLKNYLIKSVHNKCIDYYRYLKTHNNDEQRISEIHDHYTLADLDEDPLDYIITQELEEKIKGAIESLPEQYKKAFKLSRFNNLSYSEIAVEMNISVNSVKTNIKNALVKLREKLKDTLSGSFHLVLIIGLFII
ncbi:MAG: RNA polymerase sigma-70 factor [Bacteroidales bacterium]|nr:RNA polymerase sigma-70 factor [Bacteroidales bacterium]